MRTAKLGHFAELDIQRREAAQAKRDRADSPALAEIAIKLGGDVIDGFVIAGGLKVHIDPANPQFFFVYSHDGFLSRAAAATHVRKVLDIAEPEQRDPTERTAHALRIWGETIPAEATLVEVYLRSRKIDLPVMPATLRFHPRLWHSPTRQFLPAMVALVTDADDRPVAIHRTYLRHNGRGKALVSQAKLSLGPTRGGAIRLGPPGPAILIAEGVETALSGTILDREHRPAWSAISKIGMEKVRLPPSIQTVTFLADNDDAGQSVKAANRAKRRALAAGLDARVAVAPVAQDFNDVLIKRANGPRGGA